MRLEEELGVQLLSRTTRGAALTEAGATFREHASRMTAELDIARDAISPEGDVRGRLRIAAPADASDRRILRPCWPNSRDGIRDCRCMRPMPIDLSISSAKASMPPMRVGYLSDSNLMVRRIAPIRGQVRCESRPTSQRTAAPKTPEDLQHHEALMQGTEPWRMMSDGKIITVRVQGRFKADNGEALVAAALAGIGIGAVPDFLIDAHIASGALVPVLIDYPPPEAGLYVVRPPGDFPPRKVRALIDILLEKFGSA